MLRRLILITILFSLIVPLLLWLLIDERWFENVWLKDECCKEIIGSSWQSSSAGNMDFLISKMDSCNKSLSRWNKVSGASLKNNLKRPKLIMLKVWLS